MYNLYHRKSDTVLLAFIPGEKKFIQKGRVALMNSPKEHARGALPEGKSALITEIDDLKSQMHEMEMEIDILKEPINILKKTPASIRQLSGTKRR